MAPVSLVVTDLDGTFWWTPDQIHPATLAAWRTLEDLGVPILVATGRRVGSIRDTMARVGLAPPAIAMNGAVGIDLATEERFHVGGYDRVAATTVLAAHEAHDVSPCVYVDHPDVEVFVSGRPSTHPGHIATLGSCVVADDLDRVVAEESVLSFGVLGLPWPVLSAVTDGLAGVAEPHLGDSIEYPGAALTVAPLGRSKWDGVLAYCERAGLDPADSVALGDGPNDLELLGSAGFALVPETGADVAKARADVIIPGPDDGGWARVLDIVHGRRAG